MTSIHLTNSFDRCIQNFLSFSNDATQGSLKSEHLLTKKKYIQPKKYDLFTSGINKNQLLELNKLLYGLCDGGDYWGVTMKEHVINDLNTNPVPGGPFLYIKRHEGKFIKMTNNYIENYLIAGNDVFEKQSEQTWETFDSKPTVYD